MQIIQSKLLNTFSNIRHGFTSREDGNIAFHVGDDINSVILNHKKLAKKLDYDINRLVHMRQIHSKEVKIVTLTDNFKNPPTCDALITDKKNTPLMVMVADCSPILFYDVQKEVIAVAHAGREGTFQNIVQNVINSFRENFDSEAKNIYVSVGASIKSCCYEVGRDIFKEAKHLQLEKFIEKKADSYYLDISGILKKQLLASGVEEQNIEFINQCTSCNTQTYFSYRAEKETGRFCGIIMLT